MKVELNDFKYYLINCKKIFSDYSYEVILLDIINHSKYFLKKSNWQHYDEPDSESHSEDDANTEQYKLDFKLLVSQKMVHIKSKNAPDVDYSHLDNGYITVQTHNIEPYVDDNILFKLLNFDVNSDDEDLKSILKNLNKKKNLFWFFPFEFSSENTLTKEKLTNFLNYFLKSFLEYRLNSRPNYDTYVCVKYGQVFVIYKQDGTNLIEIDEVNELICSAYRKIDKLSLY